MQIQSSTRAAPNFAHLQPTGASLPAQPEGLEPKDQANLREAFDQFVGQTFFQQMLSAMRKTVDKPAYFHGGRAEEVFQGQLDQVLSERMTEAAAEEFTDPMFELFTLARR
jgi:Rod binding domain-containing protein